MVILNNTDVEFVCPLCGERDERSKSRSITCTRCGYKGLFTAQFKDENPYYAKKNQEMIEPALSHGEDDSISLEISYVMPQAQEFAYEELKLPANRTLDNIIDIVEDSQIPDEHDILKSIRDRMMQLIEIE